MFTHPYRSFTVVLSLMVLVGLSAARAEEGRLRRQRCLARFGDDKVEIEVAYRGNLVSGRGLQIEEITAGPERDEGLSSLFDPADGYRPPGFLARVRSHVGLPFFRQWSRRVRSGAGVMQGSGLTNPQALDRVDQVDDEHVAMMQSWPEGDGAGKRKRDGSSWVVLPKAFARWGNDVLHGVITMDTDNDGLPNALDSKPFFFDKADHKKDLAEEARDNATDEAGRQATQEGVDQSVRETVDERVRDRVAEPRLDRNLKQVRPDRKLTMDGQSEVGRGFRTLKPPVQTIKPVASVARRSIWQQILTKPLLLVPAAFVVYRGVDNYILDGNTTVTRTGVLAR